MDYIPSNTLQFDQALQQADELFQISCLPYTEHTTQENQALPPTPSQDGRDLTCRPTSGQKRKASISSSNITSGEIDDEQNLKGNKKIMLRDIERQRRQEMATLYASLRSQLPLEYLKGKRSISDHVNQTVNYIKHLQSNIQELHNKRDRLKRSCDISCSSSTSTAVTMENSLSPMKESVVLVRPCKAGVEVVVNTPMKQRLALARLLEILKREGLSTISCISAQVNEKLIYTIESQVSDGKCIDMFELQQRLTKNL
ncbi:hypothetical protein GBA52_016602 [Prunus armeniaca]|nr:hypothetical protein GBA52_016602 [Prunus armeniaca]